jgi:hypothetical protein
MRHGVAMLAIVVGWCLLPPQVRTGEAYTHFDANGWYKLIPPSTLAMTYPPRCLNGRSWAISAIRPSAMPA